MSIKEWKPHRKQAEFLRLPYSIREAMYGGGAGSAKTETLLYYPLVHRFHENGRFKQVFLRRTFPELRAEVVPRAKEIYKPFGATFNQTHMAFTFPSGAMIFLGHCETEDDVHKYDSMEISLFTPDELTSFTEWIYLYIAAQRVRTPVGSGLPALIRAAGMPGGIGHTWVKKRFINPAPKGSKIIIGEGGNKRIYIHATLADNPHVDPNYKNALEDAPEAEKQAKKYGSWDAYSGQVFDEFRDKHYPDEPENALHVIEPFDIPEFWPRIVVIDWGFKAMTWVGFGAVAPNGRLVVYREMTWLKTKIAEWAPYVREFIDLDKPRILRMCQSAGQDRGQEHTIQQQVSEQLGVGIELTKNSAGSRVSGKILIHEYLRWKKKHIPVVDLGTYREEHAAWLLRNKGRKEYDMYIGSFMPPEEETNLPKLQIFKSCTKLIDAIKACSYDKTNPEDVAEFEGDDPYDGLRYMVDVVDGFVAESKREFNKASEQQRILEEFNRTKDWNMVHRRAAAMAKVEKKPAIRRYHNVRSY